METPKDQPKITVAGVTFDASQVVSAVVKIEDREIHINKKPDDVKTVGFSPAAPNPQ